MISLSFIAQYTQRGSVTDIFSSFINNGEIRPSLRYKIILGQLERIEINSILERNSCDLFQCILKTKIRQHKELFFKSNSFQVSIHSDLHCLLKLASGTNRRFKYSGVMIYNKTGQLLFVVVCFC